MGGFLLVLPKKWNLNESKPFFSDIMSFCFQANYMVIYSIVGRFPHHFQVFKVCLAFFWGCYAAHVHSEWDHEGCYTHSWNGMCHQAWPPTTHPRRARGVSHAQWNGWFDVWSSRYGRFNEKSMVRMVVLPCLTHNCFGYRWIWI